jgi:hypothetical protein
MPYDVVGVVVSVAIMIEAVHLTSSNTWRKINDLKASLRINNTTSDIHLKKVCTSSTDWSEHASCS